MAEMIDRDQEHLRLLKIGYYLQAGMTCFFSLFALLYAAIGGLLSSGIFPVKQGPNDDPRAFGMILVVIGVAIFILGLTGASLHFVAGRSLRDHRRRTLCLVMAGLSCLYIPWGTALGICTIVVLNRPEVKNLFESPTPPMLPQ
jgi:hypothetical protein